MPKITIIPDELPDIFSNELIEDELVNRATIETGIEDEDDATDDIQTDTE